MAKRTAFQLGKKGQMTIPKPVRDELGLAEGDWMEALVRDREIVLTRKVLKDRGSEDAEPETQRKQSAGTADDQT